MFIRSFILLFAICISFANAQTAEERKKIIEASNTKELNRLAKLFEEKALKQKKEALEIARKKGWKVFLTMPDGSISELMRVENGVPIYYTTSNINAATTTRANHLWTGGTLGLNLNGQTMIVGEWDGGPVRDAHQEFGGRVIHKDGVSFTTPDANNNHATHVAGTLIASGVDGNAKGMAHQATLGQMNGTTMRLK